MITDSEILFWMSLSGVSISKQSKAIKHCKSVSGVWNSIGKDAALDEIFKDKAEILKRYHSEHYISDCLERLNQLKIKVMSIYNPFYGNLLRQPEVSAPYILYYKGNARLFDSDCIAVVGTRACSEYGKQMATKIASELAENGITVVSGLATGIDSYAHAAALDVKGKTIAVLGSGLNKVSPVGNARLMERILENDGAVLSEYLPNMIATKYTFPERNRLISGLSKGVCVVEAGKKSGALITAEYASEQNRDVFAVPGNVGNLRSEGTNNLLYEGALIARNGSDILLHYGIKIKQTSESKTDGLDEESKKIFDMFQFEDAISFDDIVEKLEMSPSVVSVKLTELEMNGLIKKVATNEFAKSLN